MARQRLIALACCLTLMLLATGPARAGSQTYNVTVNTSALDGQSGYLDFQLNPGGSGALAVSATVSAFTSDGTLQPGAPLNGVSGDVSGMLPGTLTVRNTTGFNDYFEGFTYGNGVSFELTVSGPGVGTAGTVGSSFAFSLYDGTGTMPLLTTDPNGSVLTVNVNAEARLTIRRWSQSAPFRNRPRLPFRSVSCPPACSPGSGCGPRRHCG
jgi:hypothetical protein